ncbi:MAG: hypothetical protein SGPRY_011165, partial [Prymnesium sp.]
QELHSGGRNSFAVDHVCSLASTQEEVFQHGKLQALVDAVIDGFNSTVFAYGQTGSGKTFTMEGYEYSKAAGKGPHANFSTSSDRLGLTPRSVHSLFASVERHNSLPSEGSSRLRVMCHFVQIYKEAVLDLLNPSSTQTNAHNGVITGLKVRWSAEREFYVDNLFTEEVGSAEQALALFQKGVGNKRVIIALSETSSKPRASKAHVPYRDGTLTRLLKQALGGNSYTLMVACISPCDAHAEENASTLAYATRARAISNSPVVNVDPHAAQVPFSRASRLASHPRSRLCERVRMSFPEVLGLPSQVAALKAEIRTLKAEIARLQQLLSLSGDGVQADVSPQPTPAAGSTQLVAEVPRILGMEGGQKGGVRASGVVEQSLARARSLRYGARLAEQREELEVAHGLASAENLSLQQKLSFYELALAMESYPSAPPASLGAQIEQQMKSAALELISLRNENASLKDQAPLPPLPLLPPPLLRPSFSCLPPCLYPCRSPCAPPLPLACPSPVLQPTALRLILRVRVEAVVKGDLADAKLTMSEGSSQPKPRERVGGLRRASVKQRTLGGRTSLRGTEEAPNGAASKTDPAPPTQPPPRLSLSTTGELLLGHAWAPPPPSSQRNEGRTVARLMPTSSTFEELDQLSALLRKRSELSASRPGTAIAPTL